MIWKSETLAKIQCPTESIMFSNQTVILLRLKINYMYFKLFIIKTHTPTIVNNCLLLLIFWWFKVQSKSKNLSSGLLSSEIFILVSEACQIYIKIPPKTKLFGENIKLRSEGQVDVFMFTWTYLFNLKYYCTKELRKSILSK